MIPGHSGKSRAELGSEQDDIDREAAWRDLQEREATEADHYHDDHDSDGEPL